MLESAHPIEGGGTHAPALCPNQIQLEMTKSNTIFKPSKQLKTSSSKSKPTAVASSAVASDTISADSYQDEEFDEYQQDDFDDYDGDEVAVGLQPQHLKMGNLSAASVNAPIISLKVTTRPYCLWKSRPPARSFANHYRIYISNHHLV